MESFTFTSFLARFAMALVLVLLTFNPTGYSYYHWVAGDVKTALALKVVAGLALLIGWLVFLRATLGSMGGFGIALTVGFFAAVIWLLASVGWIDPRNAQVMSWVAPLVCSLVLAVGVSWSHLWRRLTGQTSVDEVHEK